MSANGGTVCLAKWIINGFSCVRLSKTFHPSRNSTRRSHKKRHKRSYYYPAGEGIDYLSVEVDLDKDNNYYDGNDAPNYGSFSNNRFDGNDLSNDGLSLGNRKNGINQIPANLASKTNLVNRQNNASDQGKQANIIVRSCQFMYFLLIHSANHSHGWQGSLFSHMSSIRTFQI